MSRCYEGGQVKYITGQLERGESGNVHLQYLVQFTTAKRLNGVRAAVNDQTHWEPIYGSIAQARAYVTKEATRIDGPWEYGQIAASGKRRGYDEAVDAVMQGTPLQRVAQEFLGIWVAHGRGLVDLRKQLGLTPTAAPSGPRARRCGSSGAPVAPGKSRFVAKRWPKAFWKSPEAKWWDGYAGQEVVVLDDFKDYAMPLVDLQRLLDWYPLWVEVKGGSVPMLAKVYVITANTDPEDWYRRADVHRTIMRRITDFAAAKGRLIHCTPGWCDGDGVGVILAEPPTPVPSSLGGDVVTAIANWQDI